MTVLVADVGGTNTRVALVGKDGAIRALERFENDRFDTFPAVLKAYARRQPIPELVGCCVAVAGPVTSENANLTNRDWSFDRQEIAALLPGLAPGSVRLINDLAALGHALAALTAAQLSQIRAPMPGAAANEQALVVGLGTGVNICLVKTTGEGSAVIEAELGHASLPNSIFKPLNATVGAKSSEFQTVESLFAGRGLSRLHLILSGGEQRSGREILACYNAGTGGAVAGAVDLVAGLLGQLTRELVYMYQPFCGIHFAGGVARGILGSSARGKFLETFELPGRFDEHFGRVPIQLITDDAAALTGAAQVIAEASRIRRH